VQYPYSASRDEWAEEILKLEQLLVKGLEEKWLRKKAKELECNLRSKDRSLKLIELILVALDFEKDHASEIISSFCTLHYIRTDCDEPLEIITSAFKGL